MNKLRNVAQDNTRAEYVFYVDVDFIPNRGLAKAVYEYIDDGFFDSTRVRLVINILDLLWDHCRKSIDAVKSNVSNAHLAYLRVFFRLGTSVTSHFIICLVHAHPLASYSSCLLVQKKVLIIPALELLQQNVSFPATKSEVVRLGKKKILRIFQ